MGSSPELRGNKPPVLEVEGSKTRTVKVGQPLVLVAKVTDDGIPKATTEEQARNRVRRAASTTSASGPGGAAGANGGADSASASAANETPIP